MSKTAIISTKYVILGEFVVDGYIDKPDLIGSFFGQTEGLIGDDLEFQNLQKTGKIGRIEIDLKKNNSKTKGTFSIPTALDKIEVSLVAAAIESINKIGHTTGKILITQIKDEREEKRREILKRAEDLLKNLKQDLPTSTQLEDNILNSVTCKKIEKYGLEFYGGPNIEVQNEIILVEGRSDVLTLLSCNINNVLCFNGSSKVSKFLINLCSGKKITLFLDGDSAAKKEFEVLKQKIKVENVVFAPEGREVEELSYKEIIKCLKNRKEIIEKEKPIEISVMSKIKNMIFDKNIESEEIDNKEKIIEINKPKEIKTEIKKVEINKPKEQKDVIKKLDSEYMTKKQYDKIDIIIKDVVKNKNFVILNKEYKNIKKGDLSEISKIDVIGSKILIFDGVCENVIFNKAKTLGIKLIVCRKKAKLKEDNQVKIKLFDEFSNS